MTISARNQLKGTVKSIKQGDLVRLRSWRR